MNEKLTECRYGFLDVSQKFSENPSDIFTGDFDVVLVIPSWDPRSTELTKGSIQSAVTIIPRLENRGSSGRRDVNEKTLIDFMRLTSRELRIIDVSSENVEATYQNVFNHFKQLVSQEGRPLKVFIELTTCPRYLSLGIVATLLKKGWAHEINLSYTGGTYSDEPNGDSFEDVFTVGRWSAIAIPGLEGRHDPGKHRSYLVSVGFEGTKTYRFLASAEPDRVAVLFPNPGVLSDYASRAREANKELFDQFGSDFSINAGGANLVETLNALESAGFEKPDKENLFYLTCGSKPQSLALALRAFHLKVPAVLYPVPVQHRETNVDSLHMHWVYRIRDTSSIFTEWFR